MYATLSRPNVWLDRFFEEFDRSASHERTGFAPVVDVAETAEAYVVRAELPGVAKENLNVEVKENRLILSGKKEASLQREEGRYRYSESRTGSFSRAFDLPRNVKSDAIAAEYKDGVLSLTIPKVEEAKPKTVDIK